MRLLFEIGLKIDINNELVYRRPSARAIILNGNKVGLIYSKRYNYYKFPGGGIEINESNIEALIRETKEEAGLNIIPSTIKEFGLVKRIDDYNKDGYRYFYQENYYYLCDVYPFIEAQKLDDYESYEGFTFKYVDILEAIETNRCNSHNNKSKQMLEREAKILELIKKEIINS